MGDTGQSVCCNRTTKYPKRDQLVAEVIQFDSKAPSQGALAQGLKSAVYLSETLPHDPVRQRDPAHQPRR